MSVLYHFQNVYLSTKHPNTAFKMILSVNVIDNVYVRMQMCVNARVDMYVCVCVCVYIYVYVNVYVMVCLFHGVHVAGDLKPRLVNNNRGKRIIETRAANCC